MHIVDAALGYSVELLFRVLHVDQSSEEDCWQSNGTGSAPAN